MNLYAYSARQRYLFLMFSTVENIKILAALLGPSFALTKKLFVKARFCYKRNEVKSELLDSLIKYLGLPVDIKLNWKHNEKEKRVESEHKYRNHSTGCADFQ